MRTRNLVSCFVVLAFGQMVMSAPKAGDVPPLLKQLTSGAPKARAAAAKELGEIGLVKASLVKEAIPLLLTSAKDKDKEVRLAALVALGQVNTPPKDAVPVLLEALKADDDQIKAAAANGLGALGKLPPDIGKPALDELRKLATETREIIQTLQKDVEKNRQALGVKNQLAQALRGAIESMSGN